MRILVTGAQGMLGRKLLAVLSRDHSVVGADVAPKGDVVSCDVTRLDDVVSLSRRVMPQLIVNAAAYTAVDACESRPETAYRVNAIGARNVALAAAEVGAETVHYSTDYVFDGKKSEPYDEYDTTNPISVYGKSKLAGEELVLRACRKSYVLRLAWLFGEDGPNFAETILRLASERESLDVVDDQHGSPTYTGDVARQTSELIGSGQYGLYHATARGATTWFGFARAVLERTGHAEFPVRPVQTQAFPRPAPRPANSVLRNLNLELTVGDFMRPWEEGLDEWVSRRMGAPEGER